ncbi:DUF159 family protein [Pokkaliibacter plantistimulans]|uniref:Abasic site processing protein n=1 Tax=Proteobacteria bacterium 228 TaxID=2083153 RepID=A0A2S5KTU7_9PROT|nr:SOS response-associated peptidase [Pokkaliibacter plantistimulans]PPC77949.1 DUF159 family protein [Pokkaliibacter plantistimulans]
MCGRYNLTDSPVVRQLMADVGMPLDMPEPRENIAPGSWGQIIWESGQGRVLSEAMWSLLIEPKPDRPGYRPVPKYSTFNARSGNLASGKLWKEPFRYHRAIIPASGFYEWQGEPGHKTRYYIQPVDQAIAFGGLYRQWEFGGERGMSYSIITLPPHPRFSHIHDKSIPLMLQPADFDLWLDPTFSNTDAFQHLLKTCVPVDLSIQSAQGSELLQSDL